MVLLSPSYLHAQTKWFKYEGNPVLDVGPAGSWEDAAVTIHRVMFTDKLYRAWFAANDGTHRRIGYATSRNGITWRRHSGPVLDLGGDGTWDWREATTGYVLKVGSKYHMWYHGYDGSLLRIGYAESDDGVVWSKAFDANPILTAGPYTWDGQSVGFPFVMRDAQSGFKMWYSGYSEGVHVEIGYALGKNAKSWMKHSEPVLTRGNPGSWDDNILLFPNVLYNEGRYDLWYAGSRGTYNTSQTGYATSSDGIQWTKDARNPVLKPGPSGSWDDMATFVGDVLLDGNFYRMWYGGFDGVTGRTGYAISPKSTEISVSADGMYVSPGKDSVLISVRVLDPSGLSFSAGIESPDEHLVDLIELFDDGEHSDSLPVDGIFANRWLPREERHYSVDLKLRLRGKDDLRFKLDNAASFTAVGPMKLDKVIFMNDVTPNPGDTILIKLALRNHGSTVQADSVSATISTADKWITDLTSVSTVYGTIEPGGTATTGGYYRFFVSPNCPLDTDIPFDIQISSAGIPRWRDTVIMSVLPPWWRSNWAYGFYALVVGGIAFGLRKAEMRRLRLKQQREMERFQAERLKELDQLKSHFFANISHEFRTPLTLIRGPVEQMLSGEFKGDLMNQYEMIVRNSERLERLVNQLLDLSKIESRQMKLRVRQTDIVAVVKGIAAFFESLAARKAIRFSVETSEDSIRGWCDRDIVEKIVTNLLSNAFKFTLKSGEVSVHVHRNSVPTHIAIIVSDTGVGIPLDKLDKIFNRFYQVDQTQTREHGGTGIGLALTKELVEVHRGTIEVRSELGRGSTFIVRLPLGKEEYRADEMVETEEEKESRKSTAIETVEVSEQSQAKAMDADSSRPLTLVIEDNADMRRYIRTHLEENYRVLEAENGEEGFEKAVETVPDMVISDVMMPKMDGFELCEKLKTDERTSHIPVILLTAKAGTEHKVEGLETGADDYLVKPFDPKELKVRVKNLIEQRRRLREKFGKAPTFRPKDITVTSVDEQFLNRALGVAEAHISDRGFSADQFAKEMFLSRMQLHRKIKALTDRSPWEFFRVIRLERAGQMLRKRAGTVAEVAYQVGYDNPSHFAEAFRKHFGLTPSDFVSRDT